MAKITSVKRLVLEDFPNDVRGWLGSKLLQPLNGFIDQTVTALTSNLTIADNFKAKKYEVSVTNNQVYPIKLSYTLNERPSEVRIASVVPSDGSTPTAVFSVFWRYVDGGLQITFIGLETAKKYNVNIITQV